MEDWLVILRVCVVGVSEISRYNPEHVHSPVTTRLVNGVNYYNFKEQIVHLP